MNYKDMKKGIHYIVTKQSDDETFLVGDKIHLNHEGLILNDTEGGWLNLEDIEAGTKGMECKPDMEWLQEKTRYAYLEYNYYNNILEEYEELIDLGNADKLDSDIFVKNQRGEL